MLKKLLIIFSTWLLVSAMAAAENKYVSDELFINLRSGQGDEYRIIKMLRSGTKLTVLEQGATPAWLRIRTEAGEEGWVLTQYLVDRPVARDLLVEANAKIAALTNQKQSLDSNTGQLQATNSQLSAKLAESEAQTTQLASELEELKRISTNAITLNKTNQKLMEERQLMETEIDLLKARNERLSDDSKQTWFLYGAIAVVIGVLITLLVQNIRSRRRYSEWA